MNAKPQANRDGRTAEPDILVKETEFLSQSNRAYNFRILMYVSSPRDLALADLAETVFSAFNNSYNPPLVKSLYKGRSYYIKHSREGYSMVSRKMTDETDSSEYIVCTSENLDGFLPLMFQILGASCTRWSDIVNADCVIKKLSSVYGTPTLKFCSLESNRLLGEVLVFTERTNDDYNDGYYSFDENGDLKRQLIIR